MSNQAEYHIISNFLYKNPDILIGGSANLMLNNIQSKYQNQNYKKFLISRFKFEKPDNFFSNCFNVKLKAPISKLPLVKDIFFVYGAMKICNKNIRDKDKINIHIGMYEYIPFFIFFLKLFSFRNEIIISLYCPPSDKMLSRLSAKFLNINPFQNLKIEVLSLNIRSILKYIGIKGKISQMRSIARFKNNYKIKNIEFSRRNEFLFVGNLKPDKGLDIFLDALGKLQTNDSVKVTILTEKTSLSPNDIMSMYGYEARDNVIIEWIEICESIYELYENHKFIIFPWRHTYGPSDYPVALMEAICLGCIPICSQISGNLELSYKYDNVLIYEDKKLDRFLENVLSKKFDSKLISEKYINTFMS